MNTDRAGSTAESVGKDLRRTPPDFSLVLGGPLFQLLRRARLADDALMLTRRRVVVISLLAWLPLLAFAALAGDVLGGDVAVPFLMDVDVHAKFLLAMPLLVVAELVVHQRMRTLAASFLERNLVPEAAAARLDAAVGSAYRLRNSISAELLLIAVVYVVGVTIIWRQYMTLDAATWYATPTADGLRLTFAGAWYGYVSLPLFQFLLCRWYYRIFIWTRLLWQVSRIRLNLVPTHPDRVGGLGFLATTSHAFVPLLMAHGALLAGNVANQIFHAGANLTQCRQSDLSCRRQPDAVQAGDPAARDLHGDPGRRSAPGVRAAAGPGPAHGTARVRHAGAALRPRFRREVGAWQRRCR